MSCVLLPFNRDVGWLHSKICFSNSPKNARTWEYGPWEYGDTGMQGHGNARTWECKDMGMWECKDMRMQGHEDSGVLGLWDVGMWGHENVGMQELEKVRTWECENAGMGGLKNARTQEHGEVMRLENAGRRGDLRTWAHEETTWGDLRTQGYKDLRMWGDKETQEHGDVGRWYRKTQELGHVRTQECGKVRRLKNMGMWGDDAGRLKNLGM